jgi:hypothetical protein
MARRVKIFDCVEMKNRIQAELLEEERRLGTEIVARRHEEWLKTSDDPLAVWWRNIGAAKKHPKQPG